ncbi:SgcJ/EcaC family oxidoreductase [Methylophaga muralis]|uniref:Calcium/calmodulin dependent protein kinase II Association n=1 Tax=Methylophaga muralis TaxID=291169 RepID=A0A1E3GT82_9GAMM|nr:SgcJ/EcaC family oxidoreductase [Methylophaga muralis]ODN67278.1 Calcium/calmodulin dependent protein kinase II Association [Methylophaga muralis]
MTQYVSSPQFRLKLILPLIFGLTLTACAPEPEVHAAQISEDEIQNLFERWNQSLQTGDPAAVTANYASNAVLLPTVSNKVRTNHTEIEDYFVHFLELSPHGRIDERHISVNDGIAIDTGIYTFDVTKDGEQKQVQARYNFVYERQNDGEWLIVNHHSSAMPEVIVDEPELLEDMLIEG